MARTAKITNANVGPRQNVGGNVGNTPVRAQDFNDLAGDYVSLSDANAQSIASAVTVTGAATFTASPTFNGRVKEKLELEDVDAQNLTITAARFLKGIVRHTSVTGAGTATMDTGPNFIAGLGLSAVGESMKCTYINDGNQTVTFAVASGCTLSNVGNTVLTNASCTLICRMTAAATVDVSIADN